MIQKYYLCILAKIYKTHFKSYVAMETTDLNREAQSPEAPTIILIRKNDIYIIYVCVCIYVIIWEEIKAKF